MTNGEKFKTAGERERAFLEYCMRFFGNDCDGCYLKGRHSSCQYYWLEIEAEEEKPLPCYECGKEVVATCKNGTQIGFAWRVECQRCNHNSGWYETKSEAIAAHNRVAKAVKESDAKK